MKPKKLLCQDCAHQHQPDGLQSKGRWICLAATWRIDPLDGEESPALCRHAREEGAPCGPDGDLFEARERLVTP